MSNLNFKWGSYEKFSTLTTSEPGTLYFTKDEGGLYIGVDATKAPKRISGVVQHYESLTDFKTAVKPPYASDVIYYISSQDALVKWNPTAGENGTGAFVVLNVTASQFSALSQKVTTVESNLGQSTDATTKTTAFGHINRLSAAVSALEQLIGTGSGEGTLLNRIKNLEDNKADKSVVNTLQQNYTLTSADVINIKNDLYDQVVGEETVPGLISTVSSIDALLDRTEERVTNIEIVLNGDPEVENSTGLIGSVSQLSGNLANTDLRLTNLKNAVEDPNTGLAKAHTKINTVTSKVDDPNSGLAKTKEIADSALQKANTNAGNITTLTQKVSTDIAAAKTEALNKIDAEIKAANALTYKGDISSIDDAEKILYNLDETKIEVQKSIGDLYVVTQNKSLTFYKFGDTAVSSHSVRAGDFLVATSNNGLEKEDGTIDNANVRWVHIECGYTTQTENKLVVTSLAKGAKIDLQTFTSDSRGLVNIVSSSNNIKLVYTSADKNLTASLEWDEF